ncbi:MAG: YkgJ family cysteine cluster protein [Deltaproteobacteria bacterium]
MKLKHILIYALPTVWELLKMIAIPTRLNRRLMRGKIRRWWLICFRRKYVEDVLLPKRKAGCQMTGACCELGFGCPAFDAKNRLCKIHPYKPLVCKLFPLTEEDIVDRNLVYPVKRCGYSFTEPDSVSLSSRISLSSVSGAVEGS